jgi:hypothetical protein
MSNWNGYRASKVAGGGMLNGYATPKAKQDWSIGSFVSVGFLRGLLVMAKSSGTYSLHHIQSGRKYEFTPHLGLTRI